MRFSQIASVIATGGSAANAFLLPPTISKAESDIVRDLGAHDASIATGTKLVVLGCPGCPVPFETKDGHMAVSTNVPNALLLKLGFSHTNDNSADKLMLNGVQLYPSIPETFSQNLQAGQILFRRDGEQILAANPELGYMLKVNTHAEENNAQGEEDSLRLVDVHFEVVQVAGMVVSTSSINIKLIETPIGKLMFGDVELVKPDTQCTTTLCKWNAMITTTFEKAKATVKGCAAKAGLAKVKGAEKESRPKIPIFPIFPVPNAQPRPGHADAVPDMLPHPGFGAGSRPHHMGAHAHGHRRHGSFARFLRSFVFHVLVPIFLGVAIGITASLVGMIIGQFVVLLWRVFFRRNQRTLSVEAAEGKEDFDSLLANQSAPPVYEDSPAYEEVVAEKQ
ncbi:hypothetical protein BJ878DRAFT_508049 [Calycina marina]|uniref:DUF7728 domain-containing protein n=1 Tax=Calycina marina TaxID=1763456 RepID=A0A9P7Z2E7_9HELO|nr:hypothetical protein BJ878DRAFT_508049 [Calycina marina]